MPRFKLHAGKTTILKDLRAKAQKMQKESLKMQREVAVLNKTLAGMGDDAQLQNLKIQQSLQKSTQMIQMMSNLMRTNHDTMNKIIRNMK